jgi:hypothetical protein
MERIYREPAETRQPLSTGTLARKDERIPSDREIAVERKSPGTQLIRQNPARSESEALSYTAHMIHSSSYRNRTMLGLQRRLGNLYVGQLLLRRRAD